MLKNFLMALWTVCFLFPIEASSVIAQQWITYDTTNSGLASNYIGKIDIDRQGNKWFATIEVKYEVVIIARARGVSKFDGTNWVTYDTSNSGLGSNIVTSIVVDSLDNKWFGTRGAGVSKFDGTTWVNYNRSNSGLVSDTVMGTIIDPEGNIWFGSPKGVSKFDGVTWVTYDTSNSGLPTNEAAPIAVDRQGNIWFTTFETWPGIIPIVKGYGVTRFDGTNWVTYNTTNSGLADDLVLSMAVDSLDNKWFGTIRGVSKFDGTSWITYNTSNSGLVSDLIQAIAVDRYNNIWFGTTKGVSKFDGENWVTYDTSNSGLKRNSVLCIAIDGDNIWFGTHGGGVTVLKGISDVTENPRVPLLPDNYDLNQNYPNPFNSETLIRYQIPPGKGDRPVVIKVFSLTGQEVKTLIDERKTPGVHTVKWDGTDHRGQKVASGIYLYQLRIGRVSITKKMIFLK